VLSVALCDHAASLIVRKIVARHALSLALIARAGLAGA
jgi:hypothetical protein